MADKIEYSRLLLKRTNIAGVVPTIPPVSATTLNQFTPTDVFVGEMFANVEDDRFWIRTNTGIVELNTSGATGTTVVPTLTQVLNEGDNTGGFDISVSEGNTIIYQGLTSGGTAQVLGLDADGRTIIVTGSTGGSGTSGTSGSSGLNGTSGSSGVSGTSGSSGINGTSGSSGVSGSSGSSGVNGTSGSSGINGTSGSSGINGTSGSSGTSGISGNDGANSNRWVLVDYVGGTNPGLFNFSTDNEDPSAVTAIWINKIDAYDNNQQDWFVDFSTHLLTDLQTGYFQIKEVGNNAVISTYSPTGYTSFSSGTWFKIDLNVISATANIFTTGKTYSLSWVFNGANGSSGSSGISGTSGSSGISGTSGSSGVSGSSGSSGTSGLDGLSNSFFNYKAKTTSTSGDPGSGYLLWNNAIQSGATSISISETDQNGNNVDIFLAQLRSGTTITIQDQSSHINYQTWILGTPIDNTTYWALPVTLVSSTWSAPNNHDILFIISSIPSGTSGTSGVNGTSGSSGISGSSGSSGVSGTSGSSGISGSSGSSGINGVNGTNGSSGVNGTSGTNGSSGINGTSGSSGVTGTSGSSGISGTSGSSGINGISGSSGTSGVGTSGSSGTSGLSGVNGTSGTSAPGITSGTSGSSGVDGNFLGSSGTSGSSGVNGGIGSSGSSGINGTSGSSGRDGTGGGGATGTHFAWELSKNSRYNLSLTSEYHEIEWNLWANQMTLFPFTPARNVSVSGFSMSTTFTAGTPGTPQIVMCAYDHNPTTNLPGNLILSSSTITLQFPFVQHKYTTNYTFSAGTTYWLGYGFNNMGSVTAGFAVTYEGLMTFAAPNTHCCDEPYKFAINTSYTFPNLPNPFTGTRYLSNGRPPEICILPS